MFSTVATGTAGTALAGWAAVRLAGVLRVEVAGSSMAPTLLPGDRLLACRPWRLRPGDLVVVADPLDQGRDLVKRVTGMVTGAGGAQGVWVEGDNRAASTDSRALGALPWGAVRGRVVYRYAPPGRTGRLGRGSAGSAGLRSLTW